MPIGPFGEILGTTGTLESLSASAQAYKSKVVAPRNPKLLKSRDSEFQMTPSRFMFQMSLDTDKKLANTHQMRLPQKVQLLDMGETTHQRFSNIDIEEPMFQPFPSEIFFQRYKPFETYEVPLLLRNNDKVPRLVKVSHAESPYFKIISPHDVGHKVGPGLPTTFKLQFTPEENKDYNHELLCITEREKFVVPVKCIGARALLDFPDEVHFAASPVKYPSTKTLLVRNVGNREAKFSLTVDKPFKVTPENGILPINESMQVTVEFKPTTVGDHQKDLLLHYDTGDDIFISLYGAGQDANVRLDKNSIRIENTFITMANQRTVTISNRSNVIAHFKWTQFATQEEEDQQKSLYFTNLNKEETVETDRFLEECISDPTLRDKMSILSRTFTNKKRIITSDKMLFTDDVIKIDPPEADIWPNSSIECNIIFRPAEAKTYQRTAFCDVTGRESRLPLRIRGDGNGPQTQFSFDELDMGNIFINSTHNYEVVLANKGDIDAIYTVMPSKTVFGPMFTFNPAEGIVMPDGHQAIQMTFKSPVLGEFEEEFEFQIDGSPENSKLCFKGSVIGPTFHFDTHKLKFGPVSYGFKNTQFCTLHNSSLVPMTYTLRIPGDGDTPSVEATDDEAIDNSIHNPKEFEITPNTGTLPPQSNKKIQIDFVSNTLRKYDTALVVDVKGVGDEIVSLPIISRCVIPNITVLTPILDYGRCFLNHPYEQNAKLSNDSDLPAKYEVIPQVDDDLIPIKFYSPQPKGIIPPHHVIEVPLVITPKGLEELEVMSSIHIFGSIEQALPVQISCIGEGPVVHVEPLEINWGQIPVLTDTPATIYLSNESLIPAKFTAHMVRPSSVWTVEPRDGEIPPEEEATLTVTARLDDCVRFQDKLQINFLNSQSRVIPLMAYGHGTTITAIPPLGPVLDLGPHFGSNPCRRKFILTNSGRRHQQLVWNTEGYPLVKSRRDPLPMNPKDVRYKQIQANTAQPSGPIFRLTPQRMELQPGESIEATLEGFVDTPQAVKERLLCHAIIGRAGGKELIKKVDVKVEFIAPLLEFSDKYVFFRVDGHPGVELELQMRTLELTNVSSLPLTSQLSLKYPFQIVLDDGEEVSETEVHLSIGQHVSVRIQFDPAYKDDRHIRTIDEVLTVAYKEHPHIDYIALRGEVYFPNLDFEKAVVDFGCILNDTEVTRYINITNNSPMDVKYRWSFLIGDEPYAIWNRRPKVVELKDEVTASEDDLIPVPPPTEASREVEVLIEEMPEAREDEELGQEVKDGDADMSVAQDRETEKTDEASRAVSKEELILNLDNVESEKEKDEKEETAEGEEQDLEEPEKAEQETQGTEEKKSPRESARSVKETPRPGTSASKRPAINDVLQSLLEQDRDPSPVGVEEVFDILPLYGHLKPGDTEQITLTFYGHADIWSKAKAVCEVEAGPTYEFELKGEASLVEYRFDETDIDYGKQMYDDIATAEITLHNLGKVGFEFTALGMDPTLEEKPRPGVPVMIPHTGHIEAMSQQTLTIKYLPGVPERFHRSFQVQVAHFEPDTINLYGEGVFPRISLDLPRIGDEAGHYSSLLKEARETLCKDSRKECTDKEAQGSHRLAEEGKPCITMTQEHVPSELEIQMEVERLMVQEFAVDRQLGNMTNRSEEVQEVTKSQVSATDRSLKNATDRSSKKGAKKSKKPKPRLADYQLDFGYVVLGTVRTHIVRATNTGMFPCSFSVDRDNIHHCGFNVELDRVRQLPGAPDHETVDFVVSFDPRGANLSLGSVETEVPVNIVGGPQVCMRLSAHVTMPDMEISTDTLEFEEVRCGECKVVTVQLHNHKHVRCEWSSISDDNNKRKIDKTIPMHLRRKMRQEKPKPKTFEMMPPTGYLMPGQRVNVQVKFMPTEEKFYEQRIPIRLSQSSQRILLLARGQGLEPRLEMDKNLVEFGPILPHSSGDEQDVIVRNPCSFPIEFYSLECDKVYLEEEKILRLMKGYDEHNTILLPPRPPMEKLPLELLDYYDEQMKKFEEAERVRREAEEAAEQARREQEEAEREAAEAAAEAEDKDGDQATEDGAGLDVPRVITTGPSRETTHVEPVPLPEDRDEWDGLGEDDEDKFKDTSSSVGVGELEITPVSAAIARHLGIDLSPEGKAARNRRGIAIVVNGAPMAGKTSTAVLLAKRYEAALLTIDGIVLEAISNGNTASGLRARELCAEAARHAEELKAAEEGVDGEKKASGGLSMEAVAAHTQGQTLLSGINAAHSVAHSLASNRKTSVISGEKGKDKHHGSSVVTGKTADKTSTSAEGGTGSQVPSSPPPLVAPIARRLSVSASVAGEDGLMSTILPEDVLVEILAERLQLNDCHRGVVFDSLETLFSPNMVATAAAILKALNNRKYLFFISLKLDYNVLKEREKKQQEEEERLEKEQEEKERLRLEEMSEDEYDNLTEDEKANVDKKRLEIKKERIRREQEERQERERREREAFEAEQRRLEEEKLNKKNRRKQQQADKDGKDGKKPAGKDSKEKIPPPKKEGSKVHDSDHNVNKPLSTDRPESHQTEKSDSMLDAEGKKKKGKDGKRPISNEAKDPAAVSGEEPVRDPVKEAELLLMQKFRTFEHAQKDIVDLVTFWDRTCGAIRRPTTPSERSEAVEEAHPPSGKKGKGKEKGDKHDKEKLKEQQERERAEKEKAAKEAEAAASEAGNQEADASVDEGEKQDDGVGVSHILLDCSDVTIPAGAQIIEMERLPTVEEVLDGLGLGPHGPPIPPPASFAVVPYPVKRRAPPGAEPDGHYLFVASSPDDPNVNTEDRSKDADMDEEKSVTPDRGKDDHTPTKGRKEKLKIEDKKEKERKRSAGQKRGTINRRSSLNVSPPPGATTPGSDVDNQRLNQFRWVIPAQGEVVLRLRFQSEDLGQFDQTLNFEIMGTRRRYQLYCRGVCAFPTISREPRIVFPHRKKNKRSDDIVIKKYILTTESYEFGPLLVGKTREKFKEGKFPENQERITVLNTSPLDADINFCFLNDSKAETYLLDPPNMVLKPGEQQELNVWAYPKVPGQYDDAIVCCVRENPEPIIFKITCSGVRPELELDKKQLHFDKVLLHRKDTKTIYLRNSTLLPVAWKISGMESLGDDFSVSQDAGVIQPRTEFALNAHFRAMKPISTSKKSIRLEVSDVENIMGLVQTENIQVFAEAYDVALDMSFPKGAEGGIDFGTIRVMDETKQTCTLKNKGKYEISYNFTFESCDPTCPDVTKLFSIIPQHGTLTPVDRPTQVQIIFRSTEEVNIKDLPILKCQVIEPNIAEGGETIASIPVKVTVRSVFSKYSIYPVNDINFGPMLVNSKKPRSFLIENKGEYDFKYTIQKLVKAAEAQQQRSRPPVKGDKRTKSRDGSSSGRSIAKPKRAESIRQELGAGGGGGGGGGGGPARLVLGMFTIYPAFGQVLPNNHQTINVECVAESAGKCEEEIAIDITDRDPKDHKEGIPYKLIAEACVPTINITDLGSIFEEHRVCKNLSIFHHNNAVESGGIYGEDENRFVFSNVIVGSKAKARFKITNMNKVPCDVLFNIKPILSKHMSKSQDIYEVEPARAQIAAHSYTYASVTFTPPSMQQFSAIFEAAIDGVPQAQAKGRHLTFEIQGEGNLPRISIAKPSVRNRKGQPLCLFRRLLLGRTDTQLLVLVNDGTLACKVDIDLLDPDEAYQLKPSSGTNAIMNTDNTPEAKKRPHTASLIMGVGEQANFDVVFKPNLPQRSQAHVKLTVVNNQYEDSIVQLVGEGYEDDISLDNIHSLFTASDPEKLEGNMADEDVEAAKNNSVHFGDVHIGEPRVLTFSLSNHSVGDCVRFQWPEHPELKFSPQTGHLHAGCTKDMTVTFKTDAPKSLTEQIVPCKITKITFDKPVNQVADWDDRMRTVKWVDVSQVSAATSDGSVKPNTPATPANLRPAKKKVVETEPEPAFQEMAESQRTIDLLVSATADFSSYKCKVESIKFKDTLMFQTRVFELNLSNKGNTAMDYNWQVVMEDVPQQNRSVTFAENERPSSQASSILSCVSDTGVVPFSIEPESGSISPGKKSSFTVKFSPLDVHEFEGRLICRIPNLEEGKQGPVISVKGQSLLPYCHFELEDSDYISGARRNPELRGPRGAPPGATLDQNTRVIEFNSIGVSVKNTRFFSIVNPTNQTYDFMWVNEDDPDPKIVSVFKCLTMKGCVRSGKKHDIGFEFLPNELGIVESFWRFIIPEQNISIPFVLVGDTKEPSVSLDRSHFNFKSLLIGHEAKEMVHVMNNEDLPFHFSFLESSCYSAGHAAHLQVEPMSGIVPPKSMFPVNLYFIPRTDKEVNFNLICNVKRKTLPLTLNVKAEGYTMSCTVLCEDSQGSRVELSDSGLNEINYGQIEVNEHSMRNIFIVNNGKFNFDYEWEVQEIGSKKMVSISPGKGAVNQGERQKCVMSFCPPCKTALRGCQLILRISNGPTYVLNILGNGVVPGLHFSFQQYNFGACFIHRAGMPTHSTQLIITNKDKKEVSVDCLYQETQFLHHDFEASVIAPGESAAVNLSFFPREAKKYHEKVEFEINGLSKQVVEIMGSGTEMRVEVANPKQKITNFGALRIDHVVKKIVPIVNNSPAPISFHLAVTPSDPLLQQPGVLILSPTSEITLAPRGGTRKVEVAFAPKSRVPQFTEEVMMECAGLYQPLFVLSGSCQGIEITLDADAIPFGAVIQKSQSTRSVVMSNSGDIGARFNWDIAKFAPDFSISPVEGYISPGMEVPFEIAFHPQEQNQDIRYEGLRCRVEGGKPLKLTLTGMCTGVAPLKEVQHFTTHVRQKETKNLMIINRTNQVWKLKPKIDGEFWTGSDTIVVEPQQTKPYELAYKPLVMTQDNKKHTGTVFFPLPDGTGLLYQLQGTSEPPRPNGRISRDVPCKTQYTEMLTISNWLKKPQRFKIKFEMMKPDKLDPGTTLKGLDYIDVPGNAKRDYKLTFNAHKEGLSQVKVIFTNEQTSEYQYYEVTFKSIRPGILGTIDLSTPVRQTIQHTLFLENPLPQAVTFQTSCNVAEVMMPSSLQVPAHSENAFNLEYLPLKVGETQGRLEFNCNELGLYMYDMNLKATLAGPERALYFRVNLGSSQVQSAKFLNFSKVKTDYTCKCENGDFHVDKTIAAAPGSITGTEVAVEVTYEPSRLGESRGSLVISSNTGGEYTVPLFGTCMAPKPQGPYTVKAGGNTSITFRNIFSHTTAFSFQVDNPAFHLVKTGDNIRSRKDHRIVVGFDGTDTGSKSVVMGKLTITCAKSAGGTSSMQWVYYLKGITP
ncbi:hydrocephalus-inducing protein-like isoform X2 [Lineus longissimus]|uniref:hydrocephalus-inducing protein-like isoform X2 n=1 Tax=Lineus longissimus TaxID=88925 RepID=UPI00315CE989